MTRPILALIIVAATAVASCGSSDSQSEPEAGADSATDVDESTTDTDSADTDSDADADSGDADADTDSADAGSGDADNPLEGLDFGEGLARVTIGDTSYEFSLGGTSTVGGTTYLGVCQTLFGLVAGGGYDVNGQAITIEFDIPPEDWETYDDGRFDTSSPRIEIEIDDNGGWTADQTLGENQPEWAGKSQIDSWVSDGVKTSGTATFIPVLGFGSPEDGAEPVQGTFEIGCAEDG